MSSDAPRSARGPADTCSRRFATFRKTARTPAPLPRRPPQKTPSFFADTPPPARGSGPDKTPVSAGQTPQQTRNASGTSTPSDNGSPSPPSRPELLSPSNTRVVTAFLTQTPVSTLPSACRASFPEACVTRVTAHFASNRQEKATALRIADRGFASPLGSSDACRQSQGAPRPFLRAATSAQDGVSKLSAPAAPRFRFTGQTARRPESILCGQESAVPARSR